VATSAATICMATMAADPVFIDTNLLVAASVSAHPSHGVASAYLGRLATDGAPACISGQVCREFLVVLTRQPVEGRAFSVDEALAALDTWRRACVVLEEDGAVLAELLGLVRRHGVKGKQVHDANIVATMRANGLSRLATLNAGDFARFEDEIAIEALVS
jgi:predicted nucleic acid-binding protein